MFFKKKKTEKIKKRYVINVITEHKEGGYSSHWYGWSDRWLFTLDEAKKIKSRIEHLYDEVEIMEFD